MSYGITFALLVLIFPCCAQQIDPENHVELERSSMRRNKPTSKRKVAGQACKGDWSVLGEYLTPECKSAHRSLPTFQSGNLMVGPSLYSPLKVITHSFRKSFRCRTVPRHNRPAPPALSAPRTAPPRRNPRVIATAVSGGSYNDTFVVTVRSVSPAAFAANVYRVDQSLLGQDDGWRQPLNLSYIAWEEGAESPAGTVWGSWAVAAPAADGPPPPPRP